MSEYLGSPQALGRGARDPFTAYGQQSASYLVNRMRSLPPGARVPVLKSVLDAVDPDLWRAAERTADARARAGVPAPAALEQGIATAMSRGVQRELVTLGRTRKKPSGPSLLGGCPLGDVLEELGAIAVRTVRTVSGGSTSTPTTRDHRGTADDTQRSGHGTSTPPPAPAGKVQLVQIGPFTFSPSGGGVVWHKKAPIPENWRTFFVDELKKLSGKFPERTPASAFGLDKTLGMSPTTKVAPNIFDGRSPAFRVKSPVDGSAFGIYFTATADGTIGIQYKKLPALSWWDAFMQKIINALMWLPCKLVEIAKDVYDAAKDAAKYLADQACKLVNSGAAQAAITAGATAIAPGGGTAAAQIGLGVAQQMCNGAPPEPVLPLPPPPPPSPPWLLPVLGGGALLLVIAATR